MQCICPVKDCGAVIHVSPSNDPVVTRLCHKCDSILNIRMANGRASSIEIEFFPKPGLEIGHKDQGDVKRASPARGGSPVQPHPAAAAPLRHLLKDRRAPSSGYRSECQTRS